jgi:hypothetical protein
MGEIAHPFTFMIRRVSVKNGLLNWVIYERHREREFSKASYASEREASEAARARMEKLIATWRIDHGLGPAGKGDR